MNSAAVNLSVYVCQCVCRSHPCEGNFWEGYVLYSLNIRGHTAFQSHTRPHHGQQYVTGSEFQN